MEQILREKLFESLNEVYFKFNYETISIQQTLKLNKKQIPSKTQRIIKQIQIRRPSKLRKVYQKKTT